MTVIVKQTIREAPGIALCLRKNVLRTERQLLGFENADDASVYAKGVISGSVFSWEFFDGASAEIPKRALLVEGDNFPPEAFKLGIDSFLTGQAFRFHGTFAWRV